MAKALSKTKVKTSTKKVAGVAGKVLTATAGLNAQISSQKKLLQSAKTEKRAAERVETTWMNRLKTAISRRPDIAKYTEEQFAFWIDCLNSAAGWVDNNTVVSGIYRDIGFLLSAKGDTEGAIKFYEGSLDADPDTAMRFDIERRLAELRK